MGCLAKYRSESMTADACADKDISISCLSVILRTSISTFSNLHFIALVFSIIAFCICVSICFVFLCHCILHLCVIVLCICVSLYLYLCVNVFCIFVSLNFVFLGWVLDGAFIGSLAGAHSRV